MKKVNFKQRWVLYNAGLSVKDIKLREQAIHKQAQVLLRLRDFEEAQWRLLDAMKTQKTYSLLAVDGAFMDLQVRRGQLA